MMSQNTPSRTFKVTDLSSLIQADLLKTQEISKKLFDYAEHPEKNPDPSIVHLIPSFERLRPLSKGADGTIKRAESMFTMHRNEFSKIDEAEAKIMCGVIDQLNLDPKTSPTKPLASQSATNSRANSPQTPVRS